VSNYQHDTPVVLANPFLEYDWAAPQVATPIYEYDWAAARLTSSIDVEPMRLANPHKSPAEPYLARIVQVASGHDNWAGHAVDEFSVGRCLIRAVGPVRENGVRQARTNCNSGHKGSGGVFGSISVDAAGHPVFLVEGMQVGSSGVNAPRAPFDVTKKYSVSITVEGGFRDVITRLAQPN
jgi:hypothetical protein